MSASVNYKLIYIFFFSYFLFAREEVSFLLRAIHFFKKFIVDGHINPGDIDFGWCDLHIGLKLVSVVLENFENLRGNLKYLDYTLIDDQLRKNASAKHGDAMGDLESQ